MNDVVRWALAHQKISDALDDLYAISQKAGDELCVWDAVSHLEALQDDAWRMYQAALEAEDVEDES